jgi:uncharacterized protein YndB with AHSA1/START domain
MGQWADLDARVGGRFHVDINGSPVRGEYVELDPPRRVVVSWGVAGNDELPPGSSRVSFTLVSRANGTRLELHHTDLPETQRDQHERGWSHFLPLLERTATR